MHIINGPRGSGKTHYLIDWYLQDPENRGIIAGRGNEHSIHARIADLGVFVPPGSILGHPKLSDVQGNVRDWAIDDFDMFFLREFQYLKWIGPCTTTMGHVILPGPLSPEELTRVITSLYTTLEVARGI